LSECRLPSSYDLKIPRYMNDTSRSHVCILLQTKFASKITVSAANKCTFTQALLTLSDKTVLSVSLGPYLAVLGNVDTTILSAKLASLFFGCSSYGLPYSSCYKLATAPGAFVSSYVPESQLNKIPENLEQPGYSLCTGLALKGGAPCVGTDSFFSFVSATVNTYKGKTDPDSIKSFGAFSLLQASIALCPAQPKTKSACLINGAVIQKPALTVYSTVTPTTVFPSFISSTVNQSRAEFIDACKNNDVDISKFQTAQALVTSACVILGLGAVISLASIGVKIVPVAIGGGAFSLIGGILILCALFTVKSAPVYLKVGGQEVNGTTFYQASSGQLLAFLSIIFSVLGGIITVVSGFLNKGRDGSGSVELTSKVDSAA